VSFDDACLLMGRSLTTVAYSMQPAALLLGTPSRLPRSKVLEFTVPVAPFSGPALLPVSFRPPVPEAP
jgi:hypothetical protein